MLLYVDDCDILTLLSNSAHFLVIELLQRNFPSGRAQRWLCCLIGASHAQVELRNDIALCNCIASCLCFAATPQSPRPMNSADSDDDDDDDDRNMPIPQRRVPSFPSFNSGSIEDSSLVVRGTCA